MMNVSKRHVYFIEGGDNVGKTTTIQTFKQNKYIESIRFNRVRFSKYPTSDATNTINRLNTLYKENEARHKNKEVKDSEYVRTKKSILESLINTMICDMISSFDTLYNDKWAMACPDDVLEICDRGFLSTYLYQYRDMPGLMQKLISNIDAELEHLKAFINKYLPPTMNDINVIILNNNANPLLADIIMDDTETIEYKKDFDNNIELQTRINNSLNNIVRLIQQDKVYDLLPIKFYYINIFDETGSIRKTPDEICKEIRAIINKEE
jgi:thymidylate kinase